MVQRGVVWYSTVPYVAALSMQTHGCACLWKRCVRYVAVCCSVLHCVALCCTALHCVALRCTALHCVAVCCTALHCVAVCCTALHCVAVCCAALHCVAVLQTVAVWCSVLSREIQGFLARKLHFLRDKYTGVTVSAEIATPPISTNSRNSNSSVQIQINPKSQFELVLRDTKKFECLDLVEFVVVAFSVESVVIWQA